MVWEDGDGKEITGASDEDLKAAEENLQSEEDITTDKKKLECPECGKEYTDERWYANHLLKKHGITHKNTVGA